MKEIQKSISIIFQAKKRGIKGLSLHIGAADIIVFTHYNEQHESLKTINTYHTGSLINFSCEVSSTIPFKNFYESVKAYINSLK